MRARRILRAVDPVCVAGDGPDARRALQGDGEAQQDIPCFGPPRPAAPAANRDGGLPARQQHARRRVAGGGGCARYGRYRPSRSPARGSRPPAHRPGSAALRRHPAPPAPRRPAPWRGWRSSAHRQPPTGGGKLSSLASKAAAAGGKATPYCAIKVRTAARLGAPATVGPLAITAGSSPGTSEITSVTTRAGAAAAANRPALMPERCLRTAFITPDRRARRQQRRIHRLLVRQRQPRARQRRQGRSATGDQRQHQVLRRAARRRRLSGHARRPRWRRPARGGLPPAPGCAVWGRCGRSG